MNRGYASLGAPLSQILRLGVAPLNDTLREILNAIDAVHVDGGLPSIQVRRSNSRDIPGFYDDGVEPSITVSRHGYNSQWTFVHEIGHFLDHQGLGVRGSFASEDNSHLQAWREAVMQTWPITNLEKIRDEDIEQAEIRTDNGERHLLMIDRRQVEYYLRPREIFARCYAQFVARLTDHNVLTKELKHQLRPGYADIFSLQWNEDEFAPIASAIVATFKQKGWM